MDYTFVQVAVGQEKIDMSGNCGNMSSGVGPFALDEGLVKAKDGQDKVRFPSVALESKFSDTSILTNISPD